jgi:uncharacterized protein (DUF305 family)
MNRTTTTSAGILLAVLTLGGCAGEDHNDADVEFATTMIGHHAQAIQMANYTIGRDGVDPRIAELAEEIRISQTEEIDTLSGYLRDWGEEVPETGFATGDSHSHSEEDMGGDHEAAADMPGMMSDAEMEDLATAQGDEFARMWMQMMVEHHEGAVAMVDDLQEEGEHEDLAELAGEMEDVQRTEIRDLERWQADL